MAYELARDCHNSFKHTSPTQEQAKRNVDLMRKAAFSFCQKKKKSKFELGAMNQVGTACEQHPANLCGNLVLEEVAESKSIRQVPSSNVTLSPDSATISQPTTSMLPGQNGEQSNYVSFYF